MASVEFVTKVSWPKNPGMQKIEPFRFEVPGGVPKSALRSPKYVDYKTMSAAKISGSALAEGGSGQLGSTKGLVTADLSVRFDDPRTQWKAKPLGDPAKGPAEFTFQGGKVHIELELAIYVLEYYMPKRGEKISEKVFAIIYGHELLHVGDYLDMLGKWLIPELKRENFTNKMIQGTPIVAGHTHEPLQKVISDFPADITSRMNKEARYIWDTERNRRQAIRDSATEYRKVDERVQGVYSGANIPKR
jgi:hypothetical protein